MESGREPAACAAVSQRPPPPPRAHPSQSAGDGDQEQDEREAQEEQREYSYRDNNDEEKNLGREWAMEADRRRQQQQQQQQRRRRLLRRAAGKSSFGSGLRFSLLAKRNGRADADHQGLLSWRSDESGSSAAGLRAPIVTDSGSSERPPADYNSAMRALERAREAEGERQKQQQQQQQQQQRQRPANPAAYSKMLLGQYLPSRLFNLSGHDDDDDDDDDDDGGDGDDHCGGDRAPRASQMQLGLRAAPNWAASSSSEVESALVSERASGERAAGARKGQEEEASAQVEVLNFASASAKSGNGNGGGANNAAADCRLEARSLGPAEQGRLARGRDSSGARKQRVDGAPASLAKSIASAWSRLKISPASRSERTSERGAKSPLVHDHDNKGDDNNNNNNYHNCHNPHQRTQEAKQAGLEVPRRRQAHDQATNQLQSRVPTRASGRLELRDKILCGKPAGSPPPPPPGAAAVASEGQGAACSAGNKWRLAPEFSLDSNNNSAAGASGQHGSQLNRRLSQYACQLRRGARDSNCLLEEEEEEDDDDDEEFYAAGAGALARSSEGRKSELGAKKMAEEEARQTGSSNMQAAARQTTRGAETGNGSANGNANAPLLRLASACQLTSASAIWLLLLLLAGGQLSALGQQQQQHQPPFTRSQQTPAPPQLQQHHHQQQQQQQQPPLQTFPQGGHEFVGQPQAPPPGRQMAPPAMGSLVANVSCNKIRGHVTLTPNLEGGATVTTQIVAGPPGEVYQWSIHQFPIKPGAAMCACSSLILGSKLVDLSELHGNLPSDQEFSVQSSLQLFGLDSPLGHSLLLRGIKTGMLACGTFLPTNRKSNYRAKFHSPLSGSITIFQSSFGTSFLSHLMYSNGTRRHSMHRVDLVRSDDDIITTSLLSGQQIDGPAALNAASATGMPPPLPLSAGGSGKNLDQLEQREHENELQACGRLSSGEPLFKNLTYQLSVSTENFGMRGRTALVLPQIAFESFSSVYVVIYSELDPNEAIACAPLRFVKPKTAAAKFQSVSVQGNIVFSQDSPYDVTLARVHLNFPNGDGHSYGIDELPMIIRRKSDTRVCPNIREIIYNPHHVEPSSVPAEGEATSDQYAVGDLSGKYGSLTGKTSERLLAADHNLPLFGPVSIIGRALTIYSAEGVAIACSNVELTTPMTTAFATFDFGIQGQFIFRQPMNDCNGDTYVYIEVSKPTNAQQQQQQDRQQAPVASLASNNNNNNNNHNNHLHDSRSRSLDHNWHIHANPVDSGLEHLSTTECSLAGAHFNPYNTSTGPIYSRDCTPFNVLRCELGDLASKMFTIEIPPYKVKSGGLEPDIGKFFGTDIDLPLCGPVSIVNRSVVVHAADFGLQPLACSTVIEFKPRL